MFSFNKAQMNKLLLGAIIFAVLAILMLIFIRARHGDFGALLDILP